AARDTRASSGALPSARKAPNRTSALRSRRPAASASIDAWFVDASRSARAVAWAIAGWEAVLAKGWNSWGGPPYHAVTVAAAQCASRSLWQPVHAFGVPSVTDRSGRGTRRP